MCAIGRITFGIGRMVRQCNPLASRRSLRVLIARAVLLDPGETLTESLEDRQHGVAPAAIGELRGIMRSLNNSRSRHPRYGCRRNRCPPGRAAGKSSPHTPCAESRRYTACACYNREVTSCRSPSETSAPGDRGLASAPSPGCDGGSEARRGPHRGPPHRLAAKHLATGSPASVPGRVFRSSSRRRRSAES